MTRPAFRIKRSKDLEIAKDAGRLHRVALKVVEAHKNGKGRQCGKAKMDSEMLSFFAPFAKLTAAQTANFIRQTKYFRTVWTRNN